MRIAYLDESGRADDTEFVGMAGMDAEEAEWAEFSVRWNAALERHGAPFLHMKDFAGFRGPYRGWTEPQRRALMADCLATIEGIPIIMFGAVMKSEDFVRLPADRQEGLVDPYFLCFQECLLGSALAGYMQTPEERVHVVYSQQDEFRSRFKQMYEIWKTLRDEGETLGDIEFMSMVRCPPLQLADLLAYELVHYYHLKTNRPDLKPRVPFKRLSDHQMAMRGGAFKYMPYWMLDMKSCDDPELWKAAQRVMWSDVETWGHMLLELAPETVMDWNRLHRISKLGKAGAVEMLKRREIKRKFGNPVSAYDPKVG